jgi:hypothetical protein
MLELISCESSPTADSGPDLRTDRWRPTQQVWWAPIAQCHIRGSGGHGLKTWGSLEPSVSSPTLSLTWSREGGAASDESATTGLHRRRMPPLPCRRTTSMYTVTMVDFSTKPKWLGTSPLSLSVSLRTHHYMRNLKWNPTDLHHAWSYNSIIPTPCLLPAQGRWPLHVFCFCAVVFLQGPHQPHATDTRRYIAHAPCARRVHPWHSCLRWHRHEHVVATLSRTLAWPSWHNHSSPRPPTAATRRHTGLPSLVTHDRDSMRLHGHCPSICLRAPTNTCTRTPLAPSSSRSSHWHSAFPATWEHVVCATHMRSRAPSHSARLATLVAKAPIGMWPATRRRRYTIALVVPVLNATISAPRPCLRRCNAADDRSPAIVFPPLCVPWLPSLFAGRRAADRG